MHDSMNRHIVHVTFKKHYKSQPNSDTLDITFVSSKVIQKNIYVTTETYDVTMPWLGRVAVHKYAK